MKTIYKLLIGFLIVILAGMIHVHMKECDYDIKLNENNISSNMSNSTQENAILITQHNGLN